MNPISKIFSFIYNDLKEDAKCVAYIWKQSRAGKPILDPYKKKVFFNYMKQAPKDIFKESWPWLLAILFTGFMGYMIGVGYCEMKCTNYIYDNYIEPQYPFGLASGIEAPGLSIFQGNISQEDGQYEYQGIGWESDIPG